MKHSNNERGSAFLLELILVGVVLVMVGVAVYNSAQNKKPTGTSSASPSPSPSPSPTASAQVDPQKRTLANGSVAFSLPKGWTEASGGTCSATATAGDLHCLNGAILYPPGNPMSQIYGKNNEPLKLTLSVYQSGGKSAKDWFLDVWGGSIPTGSDETSTSAINGYDSYYYQQIDRVYHEINYTFSASGKLVFLQVRVLEGWPELVNATKRDDITQYIPDIKSLAESISIK